MKHSFAIGIPTINRADLLNPTLQKYFQDFPNVDIYILDNGSQKIISIGLNYLRNKKNEIITIIDCRLDAGFRSVGVDLIAQPLVCIGLQHLESLNLNPVDADIIDIKKKIVQS